MSPSRPSRALHRCFRLLGRAAAMLALIIVGVAVGKTLQYAAVGLLADRLGFELASALGIAPFILLLLYLQSRLPRLRWQRR